MVDEKELASLRGGPLFPKIFQAFRLAIQPSKLAMAFAAVASIGLTGWILDLSRTVIVAPNYASAVPRGATMNIPAGRGITELDIYLQPDPRLRANFIESRRDFIESKEASRTGVFATLWRFGANEFHSTLHAIFSLNPSGVVSRGVNCIRALTWAFRWHTLYSIAFFALAFVLLSLAGGAICRTAALQFANSEAPRLMQAVHFSRRRLGSLIGAQIGPIVIMVVFGLPAILSGLIGNVPIVGELLTGLFLPLALIAAAVATVVLVGMIGGLCLMPPAVAYEDSDSFDAISRSFIVYRAPWRMAFYTIIALFYGAACYLFVRLFAFLLLWLTHRFLQIGFLGRPDKLHALWPAPTFVSLLDPASAMPDTWSLWVGAVLIRISVLAVIALVVSFLISFYFSASTIIYALIRKRVDGTPLEEVYVSPNDESTAPLLSETGNAEPGVEMNGGSPQTLKTSEQQGGAQAKKV